VIKAVVLVSAPTLFYVLIALIVQAMENAH
jgi:hypothetical protein